MDAHLQYFKQDFWYSFHLIHRQLSLGLMASWLCTFDLWKNPRKMISPCRDDLGRDMMGTLLLQVPLKCLVEDIMTLLVWLLEIIFWYGTIAVIEPFSSFVRADSPTASVETELNDKLLSVLIYLTQGCAR